MYKEKGIYISYLYYYKSITYEIMDINVNIELFIYTNRVHARIMQIL